MGSTKMRYLSKIKPLYIDRSREIIKEAADTLDAIDYVDLARDFFSWIEESENKVIPFHDEKKMTQYWIKSILLRDFGIFFPRKKSNKLTTEQLSKAQDLFSQHIRLPSIADEIGVQNLEWHDIFAGYNPKFKTKKKKNKHKKLADLINQSEISDVILKMKEDGKKLPDIVDYVNCNIENIYGIVKGTKVDSLFVQYYIYTYNNVPRGKRQSKEIKEKMYNRIMELLDANRTHQEITDIINDEFNKTLKLSSVTSMIYSNGLNNNESKKGRKKKYDSTLFEKDHINYMCNKFREGLPTNIIADRMNELFNLNIPKHGIKTMLEDLGITKGHTICNNEEMKWLETESPSFVSLQELERAFNNYFNKDYDIYTLLKNSKKTKTIAPK